MLPKTTRGKGERDQRGFQYITVYRMVGLLLMPSVERKRQMEAGGELPEALAMEVSLTHHEEEAYT